MLCCIIAVCLVAKILMRWQKIGKYLGFKLRDEEERYGYAEYGEMDIYGS